MFIPSSISSQTSILPQMEQGRISQLSELANPGRRMHSKNSVFNEYCQEITSNIPFDGKILFVQLPQFNVTSFDRQIALTKGYYVFPPTGIQYLCESIKHYNFQLKVLDLNLEILKTDLQ